MKKILLLSVIAMSFLSANVDNSTKTAWDLQRDFVAQVEKKDTIASMVKRLSFFEKRNPNLKNTLKPEEQLEFVALLNIMSKI